MKKVLPPTYFLGAIILTVLLHFVFPLHQLLTFSWNLLGLAPLVVGVILNLVANRAFQKHNTTVKPFEKSTTFITEGAFRISRNPMYLGLALILLGVGLLLGSASPFVVVLLFPVLLDRIFIVPEERMLENSFGDRFRQYRIRVRRWL